MNDIDGNGDGDYDNKNFAKQVDKEFLRGEIVNILRTLITDKQIEVRIHNVNTILALCEILSSEEIGAEVMSFLRSICRDNAWSVRYSFIEKFIEVYFSFSPSSSLSPPLSSSSSLSPPLS